MYSDQDIRDAFEMWCKTPYGLTRDLRWKSFKAGWNISRKNIIDNDLVEVIDIMHKAKALTDFSDNKSVSSIRALKAYVDNTIKILIKYKETQ